MKTTVVRSHQILIAAPLDVVFAYVSDLTRHPDWSDGELKVEALTPGPVEIGKGYISHGEVSIQKDRSNTVRVTTFEPPYRFGFTALDPDFGELTHEFTFREQGSGVLVRRDMALFLHPVVAFLFRFIVYPLIGGPSMDRALANLKARLEG